MFAHKVLRTTKKKLNFNGLNHLPIRSYNHLWLYKCYAVYFWTGFIKLNNQVSSLLIHQYVKHLGICGNMCDAHSSGEALLSWRLANGDFSQKPIICVQHYKNKVEKKVIFTFYPNVQCIIFSNIKTNSKLHKCSSIKAYFFYFRSFISIG